MAAMPDADLPPADPLLARLRGMPKVVLHDHLDGSLRAQTLLDLLQARGLPAPAPDAAGVEAWMDARAHAGTLEAYLEGFALTVAAMAAPAALARVAFLRSGLIVCAMRHEPPAQTERAAALALRWRNRGVLGFDLAGAEAGFPASVHARALQSLRRADLPITLHAGEADAGHRVLEAVTLGARRIGHGVRIAPLLDTADGSARAEALREAGVHFEVCPTSNLHTGAAASIAAHPIRALWQAGLGLSVQTDNRLISGVSASGEACRLVREAGFTEADLVRMGLDAAEHAFLPAEERAAACAALRGLGAGRGTGDAVGAARW